MDIQLRGAMIMGSFFNLDGPFQKWGTEVADIMILSVLWIVCSIPIFTMGASTTALFYVLGKKVRKEDPYVAKSFFRSFKDNFVQGTILTVIAGVMAFSAYLYFEILLSGTAPMWIRVIGLFFILQVTFISLYMFPILSRFEMPIKNILISSFVFANKHFATSILCAILFGASVYATLSLSPLSIFSFGIYALVSSFLFQRVFTKSINEVEAARLKKEKEESGEDEEEMENIDDLENNEVLGEIEITKEMKNE